MTALAEQDATGQAELVRSGAVSASELVDDTIDRLEQWGERLGVLVWKRFDDARVEAAGTLPAGPFRGVPLLLKDLGCHAAGQPTTYGTSFLRDAAVRWPRDSHLTDLLRAAGFVVLGRTTVPELGTTVTTEPAAFPPARNPYDVGRSAGGSSGGSAVAVAAGLVPVAQGGDGGGSIRIPASACGLVGLKPTRGRVSAGPLVGETWSGAATEGMLARSVRDAAALLDVIAQPMPGDPSVAPPPPAGSFLAALRQPPNQLRVGLLDRPAGEIGLDSPECRAAVSRAGTLLEQLGHAVEPAHPEALGEARFGREFARVIAADVAAQLRQFERVVGRPIDDDELEPRNRTYRAIGQAMSAADYLATRNWLASYARRVAAWWSWPGQRPGFDLLVTPTVAAPPPPLGWFTEAGPKAEGGRIAAFSPYTAPFNITGQPAISLPVHRTESGLPVGVQLVAAFGREDVLLSVAAALEEAGAWPTAPAPGYRL